jgi:hypothetical protein
VVRTGSLRTQSARHRVDHGTICGRSCANSGHCKPLCACVDRTKFVAPVAVGGPEFFCAVCELVRRFLLAAARRIATRLARARAGGVASPSDYRHALRDVARACIPGVDHNPMAVELGCCRASGFFTLRMGTSLSVAAGAHHRSIRVCGHNGHCRPADRTMANECLITIPQKPFANSSSFCSPW